MTSRERRSILLAALVLGSALAAKLLAFPLAADIGDARASIAAGHHGLREDIAELRQRRSVALELADGMRPTGLVQPLPFADPAVAEREIIALVLEAAGNAGITVKAAPHGPATSRTVQVKAEGEADFEGMLDILAVLESAPWLLVIEELSIEAANRMPEAFEVLRYSFLMTALLE